MISPSTSSSSKGGLKRAFAATTVTQQRHSAGSLLLFMASDNDASTTTATGEPSTTLDKPDGVQEGTHEELMYTLGVNLARQLGDVRPLVEDGQELAQVAKGLLDTVIGRLNEEGQRALLQRRGGELNQLISDRA